ncbi:MAG TPA: DoxX family protein [Frateuria sp.]|uniref:DoxX family protein n=1 Tax=Frateuria sp. TaxID=2211372 RepID=UPI002D7E3DCF|nr:DoxX family protein [Frateuria sp.]HET6805402.1 DoxX family protein [Frateuria sp.]
MDTLIGRFRHLASLRHHWSAIRLRLIVGSGFMEHGYAKLARGPESFIGILHALGMPAPGLLAWATILVERVGGLAVLIGAFVPLASIPMAIVLLVAIFTVHLPNGFSSIKLQAVPHRGALRATGVRDRPALPRRTRRARAGRHGAVGGGPVAPPAVIGPSRPAGRVAPAVPSV